MAVNQNEIGKRIATIRTSKKITQEFLAEKIDVTTSQISRIETGASGLSLDSLVNIAEVLEVSTDEILFGEICKGRDRFYNSYIDLMIDCNDNEKKMLIEITQFIKTQMKEQMGKH